MDDEAVTSWLRAAQRGDREAAAAFIRATATSVRRLMSYLADRDHVEDLVQETYLRAFTALPGYAGHAPARVWLWSIARRVAADQVRYNQRQPRASELDTEAVATCRATAGPAEAVELRDAVAALDPDRRDAFLLTQIAGLSYEEAAHACGCAVGTIRSRVYRARQDLVEALGEHRPPASGSGG